MAIVVRCIIDLCGEVGGARLIFPCVLTRGNFYWPTCFILDLLEECVSMQDTHELVFQCR